MDKLFDLMDHSPLKTRTILFLMSMTVVAIGCILLSVQAYASGGFVNVLTQLGGMVLGWGLGFAIVLPLLTWKAE